MKTIRIIIIIAVVAAAAWYLFANQGVLENTENGQENQGVVSSEALEIALSAQNNSGESGTAKIEDFDGKAKVTLNLTGAPSGVTQPAHIHTGSCANLGGVKYPLNFPVNGKSETTLDISLDELLDGLPLAVNVHKSAAEANIYVACGDIEREAGAGPKEIVVEINASGFSPSEVRIKAGDTVRFENKDTKKRWPASGVHPTHQICPGFDAIGGINPGESYSFKFTERKTCPMHDHLNPTQFGKIIVE